MEPKTSKKSYYLPDRLMEFFAEWCSPGREYSPKAAAGLLLYMAMSPEIQQEAERLAYSKNIKSAIVLIKQKIDMTAVRQKKLEYLDSLPDDKKAEILAVIEASKEKILGKK